MGSSYAISDMANGVDKQKAYYTVDLKASYKWKGIQGFVGVNNITDQEYSEYVVASSAEPAFLSGAGKKLDRRNSNRVLIFKDLLRSLRIGMLPAGKG